MTTELLFLRDGYLRELEARVVRVDEERRAVALDRTAFYPGGGGQPADRGTLDWGAHEAAVTAAKDRDGVVWHTLEGGSASPLPRPGTRVTGRIDWERRHLLMRTHMALHLVNAVVWIDHRARVTGANMEPGKGRVDMELATISQAFGAELEARVNAIVERALVIRTVFVARREADADPAIFRGKATSIPPEVDPVRTVVMEDLDRQACSGTHVANTREIGVIRVTKTESKGRANKRVRIELV